MRDRGHDVGRLADTRFQSSNQVVSDGSLTRFARINERIFPEATDLVDKGEVHAPSNPTRRQTPQARRMGVQDIRLFLFHDLGYSPSHSAQPLQLRHEGQT